MAADKYVLLTNVAGIPTVAYDTQSDNIMPTNALLSNAEANAPVEGKPEKTNFLKSFLQDKAKVRKFGIFAGLAILGLGIGYYIYKNKKNG